MIDHREKGEIMRCIWYVCELIIIPIHRCEARGMTSRSKPRSNDKGAAPRFAMASPSIWCRISLRAAIFSPPLCLFRPLPLYVLSSPTLGTGMMLFLIKTNPGTTDFAVPPPFLLDPRVHLTIRLVRVYLVYIMNIFRKDNCSLNRFYQECRSINVHVMSN